MAGRRWWMAAAAVWAALAACGAVAQTPVREVTLRAGAPERTVEPGLALRATRIEDERCRADARPPERDCGARRAFAELEVRDGVAPHATLHAVGPLVLGPGPGVVRHAKVGAWLIGLAAISPPGRMLPADGAPRVQAARLQVERADRQRVRAGEPVALPRSGVQIALAELRDQRCPRGVACATAGTLSMTLVLSRPGVAAERVTVGDGTPGGMALRWRGVDLFVCGVEPWRAPGEPAVLEDARVDVFAVPARRGLSTAEFGREPCRGAP